MVKKTDIFTTRIVMRYHSGKKRIEEVYLNNKVYSYTAWHENGEKSEEKNY